MSSQNQWRDAALGVILLLVLVAAVLLVGEWLRLKSQDGMRTPPFRFDPAWPDRSIDIEKSDPVLSAPAENDEDQISVGSG